MDKYGIILIFIFMVFVGWQIFNSRKFIQKVLRNSIEKSFPFKEFYEEDILQTYLDIIIPIKFKGDMNGSDVN